MCQAEAGKGGVTPLMQHLDFYNLKIILCNTLIERQMCSHARSASLLAVPSTQLPGRGGGYRRTEVGAAAEGIREDPLLQVC